MFSNVVKPRCVSNDITLLKTLNVNLFFASFKSEIKKYLGVFRSNVFSFIAMRTKGFLLNDRSHVLTTYKK